MKKSIRIFLVVLGLFCIGGLGSLFVNYIVYSKLVTNPVFSDNETIKALSSKVVVTEHTKETIIKDNESISTISAQESAGVVYVEENLPVSSDKLLNTNKGNGIVISSDGIIAIHESIFKNKSVEGYKISFFDGSVHEAKQVYKDDFSGIIFLRVEGKDDLTVVSFANSSDAISGRKLISIYREEMSEQAFFTLGILSGRDYSSQYKQPSCDYLEGAFRVDFNGEALEYGLGGPMIDFNGEMVGMLAKNYKDEYFLIASNDVKDSFERFLEKGDQKIESEEMNIEGIENVKEENNERIKLGFSCKSLFKNKSDTGTGVQVNYFIDDTEVKNTLKNLAKEMGVKDKDIIIQVDEYKVDVKNPLSKVLLNYKKGDVAKLKLLRNGEEIELDVNF